MRALVPWLFITASGLMVAGLVLLAIGLTWSPALADFAGWLFVPGALLTLIAATTAAVLAAKDTE